MSYYFLDENKKPYKVGLKEFIDLYSTEDFIKKIKTTKIDWIGDVRISTVFLCIDHRFSIEEDAKPILWETMIFGGEHDQYQRRYTSHEDALAGHQVALDLVKSSL